MSRTSLRVRLLLSETIIITGLLYLLDYDVDAYGVQYILMTHMHTEINVNESVSDLVYWRLFCSASVSVLHRDSTSGHTY